MARMLASRLAWLRVTPLGSPVLPEVYWMKAIASPSLQTGSSSVPSTERSAAVATASSVYPNSEIHRLEHIHDGLHGNSRSWISHEVGGGWVQVELAERGVIDRVVWGRDREQVYADRLATSYRIEVLTGDGKWRLVASSADRAAPGSDGGESSRARGCPRRTRGSARGR